MTSEDGAAQVTRGAQRWRSPFGVLLLGLVAALAGTVVAASDSPGVPVTFVVDVGDRVGVQHVGEMSARQLQDALSAVGVAIPLPEGRR